MKQDRPGNAIPHLYNFKYLLFKKIFSIFKERCTNADLKICQYLCLYIKIISFNNMFYVLHVFLFEICTREIC